MEAHQNVQHIMTEMRLQTILGEKDNYLEGKSELIDMHAQKNIKLRNSCDF